VINKHNTVIQSFLSDVIASENSKTISLVSQSDCTKLVEFFEGQNIEQLYILPNLDNDLKMPSDLYIVIGDTQYDISDIGIIKNLLSQKIIFINSQQRKFINDDSLLKLGFQKEFDNKDLSFFAYNLNTYNNKRDWNNSKGWANPENFNKYRW
tara:strand:- start:112 stop:570 length:459 start_codon:yes stop_codon:yes gene_type:complete